MITCPRCGEDNEHGVAYCLNPACGAALFEVRQPEAGGRHARPEEVAQPDARAETAQASEETGEQEAEQGEVAPVAPAAAVTAIRSPGRLALPVLAVLAVLIAGIVVLNLDRATPSTPPQALPVEAAPQWTDTPVPSPTPIPIPAPSETVAAPPPVTVKTTRPPAKPTTAGPAQPSPSLSASSHVDCLKPPGWGVEVNANVTNAAGRSITSASFSYRLLDGSRESKTMQLSSTVDPEGRGYWSGLNLQTHAPDYTGDPFLSGTSVTWTLTVNLTGGVTVQKSDTTTQTC